MLEKNKLEELLNYIKSEGADFGEIYLEDSVSKSYIINDGKLDDIVITPKKGIGARIVKDDNVYYTSTNDFNFDSVFKTVKDLCKNIDGNSIEKIELKDLEEVYPKIEIEHDDFIIEDKKKYLLELDKKTRDYSELIKQVRLGFIEYDKDFIVANTEKKYIKSRACNTRFICTIITEKDGIKEKNFSDCAVGKGYEFLKDNDLEKMVTDCAKIAIDKLDAVDFEGGEFPVIMCPGFGAVIFHEACGHGLEATSVAPKFSVFSEDLNTKVASEKVTLIDDGTIEGAWGSNLIDDEGEKTNKNILIENGILKTYLVDKVNSKKMKCKSNGCGRREDYLYAPTSRMSNTYLSPGTDKIEDMIKSIDYGVYCERMSGGSVNPATGEFNFAVDSAFLIEKGKMTKRIKGITLIGTSKEILKNVEMVSDDLKIDGGYCGSKSGTILVTIGQPTIKVSKILVGGKK